MRKLDLYTGSYHGTYKLIGGQLCLDFVNTISYRNKDKAHDWLDHTENIAIWAVETNILNQKEVKELSLKLKHEKKYQKQIIRLKEIRAMIYGIFTRIINNKTPLKKDMVLFNTLMGETMSRLSVTHEHGKFYLQSPGRQNSFLKIQDAIIKSVVETLTKSDLTRIKQCSACFWLYEDKSKNRSRRWCVMEDCGNRHKVNQFNKRKLSNNKGLPGT